jgi:hypothetical protein
LTGASLRANGFYGRRAKTLRPFFTGTFSQPGDVKGRRVIVATCDHVGRFQWRKIERRIERVRLRYYNDPRTGQPHIYNHNVKENEVEEILAKPIEDRVGTEGSRVAVGQTEAGRYLRVIYVPDPQPDSAFVITGYDLGPKALKALRRRRRRKK